MFILRSKPHLAPRHPFLVSHDPLLRMNMGFRTLLSLPFLLSCIPISLCTPQCYYPDGSAAFTDVPCSNSSEPTACCSPQAYCLTNSLCWTDMILSRGSCTDQTWKASVCPSACRNSRSQHVLLDNRVTRKLPLLTCELYRQRWWRKRHQSMQLYTLVL